MDLEKGGDSLGRTFACGFISGTIGAAVGKALTAPIERVKLIITIQDSDQDIRSGKEPRYTSLTDTVKRVIKKKGIWPFYAGNWINTVRYAPTLAFGFGFKDLIKAQLQTNSGYSRCRTHADRYRCASWVENFFAGGMGGFLSLCVVYPIDYGRTVLAWDRGSGANKYSGLGVLRSW